MVTSTYRLPGGRLIEVDSTACKGQAVIGFTEATGRIVDAVLVTYRDADRTEWESWKKSHR